MAYPSFNSTLVQLKDKVDNQVDFPIPKFQFYLSSIKSGVQYSQDISKNSFNSTLVQLKEECDWNGMYCLRVSILP